MTRPATVQITQLLRLLPRAVLILLVLAAPVLAVPQLRSGDSGSIIEAPAMRKGGVGFVLLMSLQRG